MDRGGRPGAAEQEQAARSSPVLELSGIYKRFDATQALADVSLMLYPGEIHALVGENGAGKSTLIKVMTGIHSPDAGTILLDGEKVTMRNSAEAQRNGIAAIYQEPAIFPDLNVAENIFIGHRDRAFFVRWRDLYHQAEGILARLDVRLDVGRPARGLAVAEQQAVEIAKAISLDVRVLVMDEPTAALSAHEVSRLFDQVRRLAQSGVAVLFISHRIDEVFAVADRLTVLRDGRLISTRPKAEATPEQTVKDMVGRDLSEFFARSDHSVEDVVLTVEDMAKEAVFSGVSFELRSVEDMAKEAVFSGVNFELRSGEILGLAGLVGAGRTDVALALFGIAAPDSGVVKLNGRPISIQSPQHAMRNGIAYLSEDRRRLGLSLPQSIAANITLSTLRRYTSRLGLLNTRAERKVADRFRDRLRIRTSSVDTPVEQLSGGNQQKTMLAKWLNSEPTVLILDEPTRGIDVGAKAEVHQIIESLAKSGIAIVLISSDLPEVIAMSDRVLVMREGHQVGIFAGSEATEERIVAAAVGAG